MKVEWSLIAQQRLIEIESYIAEDNPVAAERFVNKLILRGESLRDNPLRGRAVPEAPGSDVREIFEGNYRILYRVSKATISVLTVFEGHRLFREDEIG